MLILASKSPRRIELLKLGGFSYEIIPAISEEKINPMLTPPETAVSLACQKAREVSQKYKNDTIIGADTIVVYDGEIMGKPVNKADAFRMLKKLSGNTHSVITGVCIIKGDKESSFYEETKVQFYSLSDEEISSYIETGEPMDKAGAYGIQEKGSLLVKKIDGDYFNVVGLPLSRFVREYKAFNVNNVHSTNNTEKKEIKLMKYLNNPFTRDVTEYDGEVFTEVRAVDGKIYLSNGAVIKQTNEGKYFDVSTSEKYGTVFEASGPDEIGAIVGYAIVTGPSSNDFFAF